MYYWWRLRGDYTKNNMSKFFIGFLILFAIVGIVFRININMNKEIPANLTTYTDDELGFILQHKIDAPITIGGPIIIPNGVKALDTMASSTFLDPSGLNPKQSDFTKEITQHTTVYYLQTSQFEGQVSYIGYFFKDNFIVPIEYRWDGVDWTNPKYNSKLDPKFKEFSDILKSIEFIHDEPGIYEGMQE